MFEQSKYIVHSYLLCWYARARSNALYFGSL